MIILLVKEMHIPIFKKKEICKFVKTYKTGGT